MVPVLVKTSALILSFPYEVVILVKSFTTVAIGDSNYKAEANILNGNNSNNIARHPTSRSRGINHRKYDNLSPS